MTKSARRDPGGRGGGQAPGGIPEGRRAGWGGGGGGCGQSLGVIPEDGRAFVHPIPYWIRRTLRHKVRPTAMRTAYIKRTVLKEISRPLMNPDVLFLKLKHRSATTSTAYDSVPFRSLPSRLDHAHGCSSPF